MFPDLEHFVAAHRPCGELTGEVGEPEAEGYTWSCPGFVDGERLSDHAAGSCFLS
jgi:hypothetical protein